MPDLIPNHIVKATAEATLYPSIEPYWSGHLQVSEVHRIYAEQSGNPQGKPVLLIHGGPGVGSSPEARRFFDPGRYRIIAFDQRGCGKSIPHAHLEDNHTSALISDIEQLRIFLGIERWLVFGGSWGSTLALLYSEAFPASVTAIILRGVFLGRAWEVDRIFRDPRGTGTNFPEAWEEYETHIPMNEREDLIAAYHRRLTSENPATRLAAARKWARWEGTATRLIPDENIVESFGSADRALALARIEAHFFVNGSFLRSENQIIDDISRITHIPAVIVHGRYDAICPASVAWELHRAWPEARLELIEAAGHSMFESGIVQALVVAADRFAK